MSELQLSLIAIGAAAVAVVFAYNKWQERKHRKLAERVFRSGHADVLLGGEARAAGPDERIEPVIGGGETAPIAAGAPLPPQEPDLGHGGGSAALGAIAAVADRGEAPLSQEPRDVAAAAEPPRELIDAAVDCVVRLESAEPIGGGYLWQAQNQALGKLTKPCRWAGLNERKGAWESIAAHGAGDYRRLRVGLQLADRRGPLSDGELSLFFNGVQRLADEFLAVADIPPRGEILVRAADLDRFCAGVDIQIGVNVVANASAFAGTKLRGLAEAAGLTLQEDGMFHALDDEGAELFTLSNLEPALFAVEEMKLLTTHGLTFTLDVPRILAGARAFDRMIVVARQFAQTLGGSLVDDNRVPLAGSALALIRDKIVEVEGRMAGFGIKAGESRALRLFS